MYLTHLTKPLVYISCLRKSYMKLVAKAVSDFKVSLPPQGFQRVFVSSGRIPK